MLLKRDTQVVVSGAGPVGMMTALTLNRRGVRVAVVDEQMRTVARTYACALHPATLELLDEVGVAKDLIAVGQRVDTFAVYEGPARRLEAKYSQLPGKFPFLLVVPQPALEDALEARLRAEGVPVHWSHRLSRIDLQKDAVALEVQKLEHGTAGYGVQRTAWTVAKEDAVTVPFIVGADGHKSLVRRQLGIDFPAVGDAQVFAVWEFAGDGPDLKEARVSISGGKSAVVWPLGQGWYRFGFEVDPSESPDGRPDKARQVAVAGDTSLEELERSRLKALVAERAPWFEIPAREVAWSMAIRFERRLALSYGKGPAWILGDAAHTSPPVSVASMNVGLQEAKSLAVELEAVLRTGAPREQLDAWGRARREEFHALLAKAPVAATGADPFAASHAKAIGDSLPVSGEDRGRLLKQVGLEA